MPKSDTDNASRCFYNGLLVMACSLEIPDDFPARWALNGCHQAGLFLGNRILSDTLPRLVLNTKGSCGVSTSGIIGSSISCAMNGLCMFYLLVLLMPSVFVMGSWSRFIWYWITVGLTTIVPVITALVYSGFQSSGMFTKKEDTEPWSIVAFGIAMAFYAILLIMGVGYVAMYMFSSKEATQSFAYSSVLAVILTVFVMPVAKTILPVLMLLFGPGVVPTLAGKSFLEFCEG